jgi:hypothetical protein
MVVPLTLSTIPGSELGSSELFNLARDVRNWIAEYLKDQWRFTHEVYHEGIKAGHTHCTLERAMKKWSISVETGIRAILVSPSGRLIDDPPQDP